jgi:hypothetical protein
MKQAINPFRMFSNPVMSWWNVFPRHAFCLLLSSLFLCGTESRAGDSIDNERYSMESMACGGVRIRCHGQGSWIFRSDFSVIIADQDPKPAMRPAGYERVSFNVLTWESARLNERNSLRIGTPSDNETGDGFDNRILKGEKSRRTADVFAAAPVFEARATKVTRDGSALRFTYPRHDDFDLSAVLSLPAGDAEPILAFTLTPKKDAWYSVGYSGAPAYEVDQLAAIWQPFLWQEMRFPSTSYLTAAFQCPLPASLVEKDGYALGVLADASEFPFEPLPELGNSRFGVALRNPAGQAQAMVFAPILGGPESKRQAAQDFTFKLRLFVERGDIPTAFESIARRLYGFRDYRRNVMAPLNETLDNMVDYGLSQYSWFVDEWKGCAYSTDVPGAVKNVSSLNPLNLALVADDERIFEKRAYPILEYMLSREKFLFSLDPKERIQSPSRALLGPCAPISELCSLYGITSGASPVFRRQAEALLGRDRVLNLDDISKGDTWENHLALWEATGEPRYLDTARQGADEYISRRVERPARDFNRGGLFFWTGFTPQWIDLFRLYEATGEKRYLAAARAGARQYAMFTWMAPRIPDAEVTVNPFGKAPHYWYLKNKGHKRMSAPEERVPAWRLSEIGLTPESCGTMSGHRAIFMANYAPWMLRISALTDDRFLHDVARSAIVGRYRNFPGYHINTARTTIYEDADYPRRDHRELSVNSFHYNHIWPHASILLDYLVTDAFAKSDGAIDFPSRFIEGYAYLQSKFYGDRPGMFYGRDDALLWMPRALLRTGSEQINYLAARGGDRLYLAFKNQSAEEIKTDVVLNPDLLPQIKGNSFAIHSFAGTSSSKLQDGGFSVTVPAGGITAVEVVGLSVVPKFQHRLLEAGPADAWKEDSIELPWGNARAMILNFGPATSSAYVYLQADDKQFREVMLTYWIGGERKTWTDASFPFEFSVPLYPDAEDFRFELEGLEASGTRSKSGIAVLRK